MRAALTKLRVRWQNTAPVWREVVTLLLVVALVVPVAVVAIDDLPEGAFYQYQFAPAVMQACGHGFRDVPLQRQPPELKRFLHLRARSFDCKLLRGVPSREANSFQATARWLLSGTALLWEITGKPSWDVMLPLQLLLLVMTVAGSYGLIRLVARRWLAAPITFVAMTIPLHLGMLPQIRDYEKAPFLVLGALGIVHGALAPTFKRRLIAAGLGGLIAGFGMGWRPDLLILLLLGIVVLLLQPWQGRRQLWRGPAVAGVFAIAFIAAASPILSAYFKAGNQGGVVAVEGLSPLFRERLGLRSERYQIAYLYNDIYTVGLGAAYGELIRHEPGPYTLQSKKLASALNSFYKSQEIHLPADTEMRVAAATTESIRLGGEPISLGWDPVWLRPLDLVRRPLSIRPLALLLLLAALTILGAISLRRLAIAVILAGGLTAVTTIQYLERHVFHLSLIAFLVAAGLLEFALRWRARKPPLPERRRVVLVGSGLVGAAVLVLAAYVVLGQVQDHWVNGYVQHLESSPRVPVRGSVAARAGATSFTFAPGELNRWNGSGVNRTALLRVDLGNCSAPKPQLTLRYKAPDAYNNFTVSAPLSRRRPPAVWYVVTVANRLSRPKAIDVSNAPGGCSPHVSRIHPVGVPFLMNVEDDGDYGKGRLAPPGIYGRLLP